MSKLTALQTQSLENVICESSLTIPASQVKCEIQKGLPLLLLVGNCWGTGYQLLIDPVIVRAKDEQHLTLHAVTGRITITTDITPKTPDCYTINAVSIDGIAIREWLVNKDIKTIEALEKQIITIISTSNDWVNEETSQASDKTKKCVIC